MRILLFTGKGGVGKTTVAAATSALCARAGLRTIVLSTDPAHSLADSFDTQLGSDPRQLAPNLHAQQLDAQERMEESWSEIRRYLTDVFDWAGLDAIEAEELAVIPGLDELFGLAEIKSFADDGSWDVIVVDCAPTAETIRLLSLPEVLSWYMERLFPLSRRLNKVVAPVVARMSNLPVAGDEVFGATERFYERLDGVRELLTDPEVTTARLVVNPERMVIAEARRTFTYLSLFGYHVDAVVANRVLPDAIDDPWFKRWKDAHAEHMGTIREGFSPSPVLRGDLADQEIVGLDRLVDFGAALYGDADPAAILHHSEPMTVDRDGDEARLLLVLPFATKEDVDVARRQDELVITVGSYRRAIVLPDSLRRRSVRGAGLEDGVLTVRFGESEATVDAAR